MKIIDFEPHEKPDAEPEDDSGPLVLSFDEFQTITDDRLALARFTTVAQRLMSDGVNPNVVYHAMYRAAVFMACQNFEHHQNFTSAVHDELTRASPYLCRKRLSKELF